MIQKPKGTKDILPDESYIWNYIESIAQYLKNHYNLQTCKISGSGTNECTLDINKDFNNILSYIIKVHYFVTIYMV